MELETNKDDVVEALLEAEQQPCWKCDRKLLERYPTKGHLILMVPHLCKLLPLLPMPTGTETDAMINLAEEISNLLHLFF